MVVVMAALAPVQAMAQAVVTAPVRGGEKVWAQVKVKVRVGGTAPVQVEGMVLARGKAKVVAMALVEVMARVAVMAPVQVGEMVRAVGQVER